MARPTYKRRRTSRRYGPYKKRRIASRPVRRFRQKKYNKTIWRSKLVPDTMFIKFRYSCNKAFTSTNAGGFAFNANGPYDIDNAAGGNQPPLFDDMSGLYRRYQVQGCKIKARFINQSAAGAATVYIIPTINSADAGTYSNTSTYQIRDQQYAKSFMLGPAGGASSTCTLKEYMSTDKMFGRQTMNDLNYSSTFSNNPAFIWYWCVGAYDYTSVDTPLNIVVELEFTLYTRCSERYPQIQD